jgi:hypothetical protein
LKGVSWKTVPIKELYEGLYDGPREEMERWARLPGFVVLDPDNSPELEIRESAAGAT